MDSQHSELLLMSIVAIVAIIAIAIPIIQSPEDVTGQAPRAISWYKIVPEIVQGHLRQGPDASEVIQPGEEHLSIMGDDWSQIDKKGRRAHITSGSRGSSYTGTGGTSDGHIISGRDFSSHVGDHYFYGSDASRRYGEHIKTDSDASRIVGPPLVHINDYTVRRGAQKEDMSNLIEQGAYHAKLSPDDPKVIPAGEGTASDYVKGEHYNNQILLDD